MKLLIVLTIACAVAVSSLPVTPGCGSPAVAVPALVAPVPVMQASGSSFLHSNHAHAASGVHGSHHNSAGGKTFFDQKENTHKTKQVIESESTSKHNKGGSNFGTSSGGSFGAFNTQSHGSTVAGSQNQMTALG